MDLILSVILNLLFFVHVIQDRIEEIYQKFVRVFGTRRAKR
jgi:hypothetical protein